METYQASVSTLLRKPSGYIPMVMSGLALALLFGFVLVAYASGHPPAHEKDEGVGAHLYQLLIGCQVFPMGWFALRWGLEAPLAALTVLALQVGAILVTFAPLWYFGA